MHQLHLCIAHSQMCMELANKAHAKSCSGTKYLLESTSWSEAEATRWDHRRSLSIELIAHAIGRCRRVVLLLLIFKAEVVVQKLQSLIIDLRVAVVL